MIKTKRCSRCGETKPLEQFHVDRSRKDGRQGYCKQCVLEYSRHARRTEHRRAWQKKYAQSEHGRATQRKAWNRHYNTRAFRKKENVRRRTQNAIRSGKLKRPSRCISCNKRTSRLHAHHDDYNKPFDVVWLCALCHGERHQKGDGHS